MLLIAFAILFCFNIGFNLMTASKVGNDEGCSLELVEISGNTNSLQNDVYTFATDQHTADIDTWISEYEKEDEEES